MSWGMPGIMQPLQRYANDAGRNVVIIDWGLFPSRPAQTHKFQQLPRGARDCPQFFHNLVQA
jgi:hypothetical protein